MGCPHGKADVSLLLRVGHTRPYAGYRSTHDVRKLRTPLPHKHKCSAHWQERCSGRGRTFSGPRRPAADSARRLDVPSRHPRRGSGQWQGRTRQCGPAAVRCPKHDLPAARACAVQVGHEDVKDAMLLGLLAREHIYIEGPPGVARLCRMPASASITTAHPSLPVRGACTQRPRPRAPSAPSSRQRHFSRR